MTPQDDGPLRELRELAEPVRPGFLERVRRRIHRRTLMAQTVHLAWLAPAVVLLEYLELALRVISGSTQKDERKE